MALTNYVKNIIKTALGNNVAATAVIAALVGSSDAETMTNKTLTSPVINTPKGTGVVLNKRQRCTIAEVNAGVTLLPAVAGYKYRLIDCSAIAVGGAAAAHTTIDVLGTQTTPVKLVAYAVAQTAQNTMLKPGVTGAAILAGGLSYVQNDANTAITAGKTGSDITTATHIDFNITYELAP